MIDAINIRYTVDEDKWYKYKGVKPPDRTSHGIVEEDVEEAIKRINDHVHVWKQKGSYIFCTEGQLEHGKNVGVFKRLVRTKPDGTPGLKDI